MGPWLLIIVVAMAVVLWRLIGVAGVICQQRARVAAHSVKKQIYDRLIDRPAPCGPGA